MSVDIAVIDLGSVTRYRLAAYSGRGGHYGSDVVATVDVPAEELPKDPEELVSRLLSLVAFLVYHS
jgi:hypothetical protein